MTTKEALRGSERDRDFWKWERMKEAEYMERVYRGLGHIAIADGWAREAKRLRLMIGERD